MALSVGEDSPLLLDGSVDGRSDDCRSWTPSELDAAAADILDYGTGARSESSEPSDGRGIRRHPRCGALVKYLTVEGLVQLRAVVPVSLYLIVFQIGMLQSPIDDLPVVLLGLFAAICGLWVFLLGLDWGLMPLSKAVGVDLPAVLPTWGICVVAVILGGLVTAAEPAIAALETIGQLVEARTAPLLYALLNLWWNSVLVVAVGAGVGIAAMLGILKILRGWSIKVLIVVALLPPLAISFIFTFDDALSTIVGLAWDCGALTTGAVSVPAILAISRGAAVARDRQRATAKGAAAAAAAKRASRSPRELRSDLETPASGASGGDRDRDALSASASSCDGEAESGVGDGAGDDGGVLDGLGVVALASLWPITTVLLLALVAAHATTTPAILEHADDIADSNLTEYETLTLISPWREMVLSARAIVPLVAYILFVLLVVMRGSMPGVRLAAILQRAEGKDEGGDVAEEEEEEEEDGARRGGSKETKSSGSRCLSVMTNLLYPGLFFCFLGLTIFTFGLFYGLENLGRQTGGLLPAAFAAVMNPVTEVMVGPLYSEAGGYVLVVVFAFVLGFGATMAEPALQVLGGQVDSLTRGRIPKMRLVVTVAVGVGGGIALGCVRVLYDIEIMWMLLPLYTVAAVLMLASDDEYVGISFDSGGATTGAVTSPLILALAVALGSARGVVGFGMLALASVGPILTVLLLGLVTGCCDRRRARRRATAALEGVRYGALREDANTRGVGGGGRGR